MGGCTTYVARTVIQKIIRNYDLIGCPCLVRLNPNIPWKTRGNGAICLQVGKKRNRIKRKIGEINGKSISCSSMFTAELDSDELRIITRIVKETVEAQACVDDQNTNPGFVILFKKPRLEVYQKAVTRIVTLDEIQTFLQSQQAIYQGYKNSRGLIGATAAVAWDSNERTYELIAYRFPQQWGTKRLFDPQSVKCMDAQFPSTFDNYDEMNRHSRIFPNSPCPILYGIRGDDFNDLIAASTCVESEQPESWLLFETNQGTDDHLQRREISQIQAFESVITQGSVVTRPSTIKGGHVFFSLQDSTGIISCAAYEPTKEFRKKIRGLCVGDVIEVYGGVRQHPLTINLEKINVISLAPLFIKTENPVCSLCGKHMKSKGKKQGYHCIKCGTTSTQIHIQEKKRHLKEGFYEVPVCARRHLSKPLKRMSISCQL